MREGRTRWVLGTCVATLFPVGLSGQELADYDYENLSFRGVGLEAGIAFPSRVETTPTIHVRFDLGFLGPGFRLAPSISYWSADFKDEEVAELEDRLTELVVGTDPDATPTVDLGSLEWSDLVFAMDGQYVWAGDPRYEIFIGTGVSAHTMNGTGEAIEDTFVEDLLDRITLGVNGHLGLGLAVSPEFQLTGQFRYEILDDLSYPELRFGGMYSFGARP